MQWIAVGLGGGIGAVARYGLSSLVQKAAPGGFPVGTLSVNLIGCLLIGVLMGVIQHRPGMSDALRLMLLTGGLGSFTTFSTFSYEGLSLLQKGQLGLAALYIGGSVIVGLILVIGGYTAISSYCS